MKDPLSNSNFLNNNNIHSNSNLYNNTSPFIPSLSHYLSLYR